MFYRKEAFDIRFLRPFGSKVVVQVPLEKRRKFDPKGFEGIFVGYPAHTKGYKIYNIEERKMVVSINVVFVDLLQNSEPEIHVESEIESRDEIVKEIEYDWDDNDNPDQPHEVVEEIEYDWDDNDNSDQQYAEAALFNIRVPSQFKELEELREEEKDFWKSAVNCELESMRKYNVWDIVKDNGQQTIDSKWIFKIKDWQNGPIGKARLVVRGFQCHEEVTYAPVTSITSI